MARKIAVWGRILPSVQTSNKINSSFLEIELGEVSGVAPFGSAASPPTLSGKPLLGLGSKLREFFLGRSDPLLWGSLGLKKVLSYLSFF